MSGERRLAGEPHCATCADEAVAMRVLAVDAGRGLARCAAPGGEAREVEIVLVEPVAAGESLLVHADTAIGRAAEQPAGATRAAGAGP